MTKQVQRRRGTATQHTSFTGAEGELSVNTTNKSVHVHDNVTAGGFEAARADMDNVTSSSILTAAGITATTNELNYVDGVTSAIQTQIDSKANIASPTFTGTLTTANLTATGTTTLAGTVTADGADFSGGTDSTGQVVLSQGNATSKVSKIIGTNQGGTNERGIDFNTYNYADYKRMNIKPNGDISFYEDTGTTAKFFWDASAESLGIGTSSPSDVLHVNGGSSTDGILIQNPLSGSFYNAKLEFTRDGTSGGAKIQTERNAAGGVGLSFSYTSSNANEVSGTYSEAMRITSSGSVGIGTSSPDKLLHLSASSGATIRLESTTTGATTGDIFGAIEFETQDTNSAGVKAKIDAYSEGAVGNTSLRFFTGDTSSLDEAMRIDSSGNVGIGSASDGAILQLDKASSSYLDIQSDSTLRTRIYNDSSQTILETTTNNLIFKSASSEAMRIDSSGNLLVGKTISSSTEDGLELRSTNVAVFTRDGGNPLGLNRKTSDGDIIVFNKDGSKVGSIGTVGANLHIEGTTSGLSFQGNDVITPVKNSARTDAAIDLGDSSRRFKDLYLSGTGYVGTSLGIGTSSPSANLEISGSSNQRIDVIRTSGPTNRLSVTSDKAYVGAVTNHPLLFIQNDTERMRLDASGNVLVGTTDTTLYNNGAGGNTGVILRGSVGNIQAARSGGAPIDLNRLDSDGDIIALQKDGSTVGSIGCGSTSRLIINGDSNGIAFERSGTEEIRIGNNVLQPSDDNDCDLGLSFRRFDDIYATNGTIQTSDRNEKQDIAELSDAEQRVAVAAKGLLRKFRWKDAVAEKGDEARTHFGIIAQDLQAAFAAEGLDAGDYAMFISSTWTDEETGEERTRMGVRYSELLAFIIAAI